MQNQDTEVNAQVNGRGSCLDHNIFSVMTGQEYKLCLEVNGRNITTYINGKTANTAIDKQPVMEELYYTASSDDNNIYIKAVNVRDTEIRSEICVEGVNGINANITELSGNSLNDMNDFDNPKKVSPKTSALTAISNTFEYTFPPKSVTIFTIQK